MKPGEVPLNSDEKMASVLQLARACKYDAVHCDYVTRFSLVLFDALQSLHQYGSRERCWLEIAGILHDIGWIDGRAGHHKTTLKIILNSPMLDLTNKERLIVGSVARYHRKSLPDLNHDHFAALDAPERRTVSVLASFLRLSDGLDHLGNQKIRDLVVEWNDSKVILICKAISLFSNKHPKIPKADLFEIVFNREVVIKWSVLL
jgi:exopolyphosphatase/pppGpp-phosphohydrolase